MRVQDSPPISKFSREAPPLKGWGRLVGGFIFGHDIIALKVSESSSKVRHHWRLCFFLRNNAKSAASPLQQFPQSKKREVGGAACAPPFFVRESKSKALEIVMHRIETMAKESNAGDGKTNKTEKCVYVSHGKHLEK
jgi:hypothetical protein